MEPLTGVARTSAIAAELHRLYPDGLAPQSAWVELGRRYGVTRERIRQIAVKEGIQNTHRDPNAAYLRHFCVKCGAKMTVEGSVCLPCRKVQIPCENCGKPVTRSAAHEKWRVNSKGTNFGRYTGRVFCNRFCFGHWFAKHHGFPAHPENRPLGRSTKYRAEYEQLRETGEAVVPGPGSRASSWAFHRFGKGSFSTRTLEDGRVLVRLKR